MDIEDYADDIDYKKLYSKVDKYVSNLDTYFRVLTKTYDESTDSTEIRKLSFIISILPSLDSPKVYRVNNNKSNKSVSFFNDITNLPHNLFISMLIPKNSMIYLKFDSYLISYNRLSKLYNIYYNGVYVAKNISRAQIKRYIPLDRDITLSYIINSVLH